MSATERDLAVAKSLAEQLEKNQEAGRRRSWRRVTTLVDSFGGSRLTESLRSRMVDALARAGILVEPNLADPNVTRADTVRLSLASSPIEPSPHFEVVGGLVDPAGPPFDSETVNRSIWDRGEPGRAGEPGPTSVRLVQIDPNVHSAADLLELLKPDCGDQLTLELVEDLLDADPKPKLEITGGVYCLSSLGAFTPERADDDRVSSAGELRFAPVEFLIGRDWVVVCWHNFQAVGTQQPSGGVRHLREGVMRAASGYWVRDDCQNPGDLAAVITMELSASYSGAIREMQSWIDQWQIKAGKALTSVDDSQDMHALEVETLVDLQFQASEFAQRLYWFKQAKYKAAGRWFPDLTDPQLNRKLNQRVDEALDAVRGLSNSTRACIDLANMHGLRTQMRRAEQEQQRAEEARKKSDDFERIFSYLAAILLAPTLVAGIFGANTAIPGGDGWTGFWTMMAVMFVAAVLASLGIWLLRRRRFASDSEIDERMS